MRSGATSPAVNGTSVRTDVRLTRWGATAPCDTGLWTDETPDEQGGDIITVSFFWKRRNESNVQWRWHQHSGPILTEQL